ncbi:unnamed protein product [Strongylus vulgaris]|uniref:Uncharacterized protein n=1 Tax=Strongylus vulgaris TaxID=40348 RepID=A0A3P7HWQ3_STRVU|nr:unnamed protein product [Strongylus vulgaris]
MDPRVVAYKKYLAHANSSVFYRFDKIDQLPPGTAVDPFFLFDRLVGGVINRMLFSVPIDEEEEMKFYGYRKDMDKFFEKLTFTFTFVRSWMLKIPIINLGWMKLLKPMLDIKEFFRKQVEERKRAIEDGSHVIDVEPQDYTDAFIQKMNEDAKQGVKDSTFEWVEDHLCKTPSPEDYFLKFLC